MIRVLVILVALAVIFVVPVSTASPSGSSLIPSGLAIDAVAAAAIILSLATWRRRTPA